MRTLSLLIALGIFASGCGATVEEVGKVTNTVSSQTPAQWGSNGNNNNNGNNNDIGDGSNNTNLMDPLSFSFSITGNGGRSPVFNTPTDSQGRNIQADTILQVQITAGPATLLQLPDPQYSGFSAEYECVSYKVSALGQSVVTDILATNPVTGCDPDGPYGPQPRTFKTAQVIDFSQRLTPGRVEDVVVQISDARYDFYCKMLYSSPYYWWLMGGNPALYCPVRNVYKNHGVTGILKVRTNGMRGF
jgi:hypothetical protein